MRRRTWVVAAVAAVAVATAGAGAAIWPDRTGGDPPALREYPPGERPDAPAIAGELLGGDRVDVRSWRGDVVVVNIWGSWCAPCRAETDDLEAVHQRTQDLGVRFLGINIRDSRDRARQFMAGRVTYPSIFDPPFATGLEFTDPPAPVGPPATLVIDRSGGLAAAVYRVVGEVELEHLVRRVAAEGTPPDG